MAVQGVLVEYESPLDKEIYTNSGLLFAEKYVIITGNVLMPHLKQLNLNDWLSKLKPGVLNFDLFPKHNPELTIVIKQNQTRNSDPGLQFKTAQVAAGFTSTSILSSCQRHLRDWAIDFENKEYQAREMLSLFFILKINNEYGVDLNEALMGLLKNAQQFVLEVGQEVFIESTPFGNRAFVNSYSQGVVSNVTGEDDCFLLTDCPSAPGSEGCPVFIKTKCRGRFAIGIVISCLNWWKGEWVGLTLAANLGPLLSQFLQNLPNFRKLNVFSHPIASGVSVNQKLLSATTNSLVQIVCGSGWGTGILLDKHKGLFLTNSHVIESDNVVLHWKNEQMEASVVYKTPNSEVYDLALLQGDSAAINRLDMRQTDISLRPPEVGEEVFAAGFPIFSRDLKPKPSLTKGHVSQIHTAMLKTTCTVLPGSSGGAIFRPGGELLAVVVSNTKMDDIGVVYPRVNMAIPILAVYSIIEQFLQSGDISDLSRLHSTEPLVRRQWGNFLGKL